MDPNYDWCCPSCFRDFEANDLYPKDEEADDLYPKDEETEDEEADNGEF